MQAVNYDLYASDLTEALTHQDCHLPCLFLLLRLNCFRVTRAQHHGLAGYWVPPTMQLRFSVRETTAPGLEDKTMPKRQGFEEVACISGV
jgi:hypothetical protein